MQREHAVTQIRESMAKETSLALEPLDDTPLAERVRKAILDAILDGRFKDRLPPEDALAEMLNVSRTTIRSALQSLEEHGVVNRKRAVGTTINKYFHGSSLAMHRLTGFDALLREKGHEVKVQTDWERAIPTEDVRAIFGIKPSCECLLTVQNYRIEDRRTALVIRDIVPWDTLRDEEWGDPGRGSLFDFIRRHAKAPVDHAVVEAMALVQTAPPTTTLDVKKGQPFMRLHEVHYSKVDVPIAFSIIDADNRFVTFELFRRG
jgi:GntR family transcriptional regulator